MGQVATDELFVAAAYQAASEINPSGDVHATADYRRQLTRVLVTRAFAKSTGYYALFLYRTPWGIVP